MKRKLAVGVVVSVLFLWLAARGINWSEFARALEQTRWIYLVPAIFFTMLGHFSRAVRWRFMMAPVKECNLHPLWSATAIAFMVNNLLPARLGELVRAFVIGRSQQVSRSACFATIVYERVVDVFVLILLLWYSMTHISGPEWLTRSAELLVAFNVVLFLLLVAMVRWRERFRRLIARMVRPLPADTQHRVHDAADAFVVGLGVVTKPKAAVPIILLSLAVWGCAVAGVWFCAVAFGLHLPALASLFVLVLVSLGSMIPSAPAFLGTLQYACVVGLGVYGVNRTDALAFSAVYHATQFLPITLVGLYYAWSSHLHFRELTEGRLS